jgi:hypothetical protein
LQRKQSPFIHALLQTSLAVVERAGQAMGGDIMMDVFGGRGFGEMGGMFVDVMANSSENRDMQQADVFVREAAQQVQQAMRMAPGATRMGLMPEMS